MVLFAIPIGILGFTICLALVMLCVPIGLFTTIQTLWSASQIGNARKMLSTLLIILLWWTLPVLATLLLAWSWTIVVVLLETATWVLPPVGVFLALYWGMRGAADLRKVERQRPQASDDITFSEMALVMLVAACSFVATGWVLLLLLLIKSPWIFVCVMFHGSSYALVKINASREKIGAWALLLLVGFGVAFWLAMPCVALGIALSLLIEVTLATLWPPYVAHYGFRQDGKQKRGIFAPVAYIDACLAAYQVVGLADICTNIAILKRPDLVVQVFEECKEIVAGRRCGLSSACLSVTLLPPVTMGEPFANVRQQQTTDPVKPHSQRASVGQPTIPVTPRAANWVKTASAVERFSKFFKRRS